MAKLKVSRPVLYTALAGLCAYAYVLYTEPDTPVHHKKIVRITSSANAAAATPEEDLSVHFPRYVGKHRDPFVPLVVLKTASSAQPKPQGPTLSTPGSRGGWALTGVNTINGVPTAVVENSATGDSAFLKAGDRWNGLHVVKVEDSQVVFENALGQQTHLAFNLTDDTVGPGVRGTNAVAVAVPSVSPLPPLPVFAPRAARNNFQGSSNQP